MPFLSHQWPSIFTENGVAMGSPLAGTFDNFYMCHIENSILDSEPEFKPTTYSHYIDDIFIITDSIDNLLKLKQSFEETSILTFTYEIGINHHIYFLDVHVDATQPNILFSVYQKPH